jgi:16S rRNA (guanine(1405)-N(7))-methyltransferase
MMAAPRREQREEVVDAVLQSRRYKNVAPDLVRRLAGEELPKSKNAADAQKRTKRRLHQIFGAYADPLPYDKLIDKLQDAHADPEQFKRICKEILPLHASTAERMKDLDRFYKPIFEITGRPAKIMDLACGLNPLTIPWMGLSPSTFYLATDIDTELVKFLDRFLAIAPVHGEARANDLVAGPPGDDATISFLFKALPCLQHQVPDLLPILDEINANWLVISFPTRSLGGRSGKGMIATYRQMMQQLVNQRQWPAEEVAFSSEIVFVVRKNAAPVG